jgi:hypothetical protein
MQIPWLSGFKVSIQVLLARLPAKIGDQDI